MKRIAALTGVMAAALAVPATAMAGTGSAPDHGGRGPVQIVCPVPGKAHPGPVQVKVPGHAKVPGQVKVPGKVKVPGEVKVPGKVIVPPGKQVHFKTRPGCPVKPLRPAPEPGKSSSGKSS
jgi:hypothetical protein